MELKIGNVTRFTIKDVFPGPDYLKKKSRNIIVHQLIQITGAMFPISELKKRIVSAQASKMNILHFC